MVYNSTGGFIGSASGVNGGDTYTVRLWLDSTANEAFDAETTFTAFGSA